MHSELLAYNICLWPRMVGDAVKLPVLVSYSLPTRPPHDMQLVGILSTEICYVNNVDLVVAYSPYCLSTIIKAPLPLH